MSRVRSPFVLLGVSGHVSMAGVKEQGGGRRMVGYGDGGLRRLRDIKQLKSNKIGNKIAIQG